MRLLAVVVYFAATFLLAGCFSLQPVVTSADGHEHSHGAMVVTSPQLGHVSLEPTTCTAGDHELFLGGDFGDPKAGMVVRLVVDPLGGAAVRVFSPAKPMEQGVVFHRSECRTFHFNLDTTGWRINEYRDYRLSLELDCSTDETSVQGSLSTPHCS